MKAQTVAKLYTAEVLKRERGKDVAIRGRSDGRFFSGPIGNRVDVGGQRIRHAWIEGFIFGMICGCATLYGLIMLTDWVWR